ncbi:MAG TPA: YjbH domain-containing protein [Nitrospirota bacterium]|nr:YjbH domain-containing protein [Nitrospirota bacterium]
MRLVVSHCIALWLVILMNAAFANAGDFANAISLQGFTGLLNTPNAEVTDEGSVNALYSNQIEPQWRDLATREDNYLLSVGFFSFAEFGGRLTDVSAADIRDLSANVKIKVPFIPRGSYLPDIALGMQDVGGGSKHFETQYIVASEELWRFRFSLGAGTGPDRMKGAFGGAEFKAFEWLYLIGENDAKETNVGARLVAPEFFGFPLRLQVTAKTSLDYRPGNTQFGVGLQFPLGNEHLDRTPLPEKNTEEKPTGPETKRSAGSLPDESEKMAQEPAAAPARITGKEHAAEADLQRVREKLTAEGFQNVRVGTKGEALLVVEYENNRYNYNELDGLGVVIGIVADTLPGDYETFRVIVKKQGIAMLELSAPLGDFRAFLHDPGKYRELNDHLRITENVEKDEGVDYRAGPANSSWLDSSLVVYPGLKTLVATEVGTFDYLLSAKLDYFFNAWKGAVVNARWDIPLAWSENFDNGRAFRYDRAGSQLDRLMLFQAVKAAPGVMVNLGGGMIMPDYHGTLNEVMWTPGDGTHRFSIKQAYATSNDVQDQPQKCELYLGSYRYYFSPLNLSLEGTVGRFFDNDKGFRIDMKRFFGDTAISVYYANSQTASGDHVQIGGVMIALPLTPRRDMKPGILQVEGYNDWSYAQETKIVAPGESNVVTTSTGVDPTLPYNLERVFYNRDRLNEPYIREHLFRLRDAYRTYGQ